MSPPGGSHFRLRENLREAIAKSADGEVCVRTSDLLTVLDYIDRLEDDNYTAWENAMGEDL
jgi:hypothetical protein